MKLHWTVDGWLFYLRARIIVSDAYLDKLWEEYKTHIQQALNFYEENVLPLLDTEREIQPELPQQYEIHLIRAELDHVDTDLETAYINLFSSGFEAFKSLIDRTMSSQQNKVFFQLEQLMQAVPITKKLITPSDHDWEYFAALAKHSSVPEDDEAFLEAKAMYDEECCEYAVWYFLGVAIEKYSNCARTDLYFRGMLNHLFSS